MYFSYGMKFQPSLAKCNHNVVSSLSIARGVCCHRSHVLTSFANVQPSSCRHPKYFSIEKSRKNNNVIYEGEIVCGDDMIVVICDPLKNQI